jgi:hypothetical protein
VKYGDVVVGRDEALRNHEKDDCDDDPRIVELHSQFVAGELTDDDYFIGLARLKQEIDPVHRDLTKGPVLHKPKTRVDYVDGRHCWGGTAGGKRGGKSAGARWLGHRHDD